jgi:NhaP-type Na+/H+ or K+/H+ antiporter
MEGIIISLAALIFAAHLFSALFAKTGVPEVLPLMLLGIVLGPAFHIVKPEDFGMVDKVFTQILLIIILFNNGIRLRISRLRGALGQSSRIILTNLLFATLSIATFCRLFINIPWYYGFLTGIILASNSFAITIPMAAKLNISENVKTVLSVESTLSGVISIVITVMLVDMSKFNPTAIAAKLMHSLLTSLAIGAIAAVFWTKILAKIRKLDSSVFPTFAFVLAVYAICESLGSDGAIGAFIFGITAGNIRALRKMRLFRFAEPLTRGGSESFNYMEKTFFREILFVMRAFFFVYIGISMQFGHPVFILCGLAIIVLNFIARTFAINGSLDKTVSRTDATMAAATIPKGLIAAALTSLVVQSDVRETLPLRDIIYSAIFFSILFSTVFAAAAQRGHIGKIADALFKKYRPSERL